MSDQDIILRLEGISKEFPGVKALDNVNLEVKKGEVHVLLGENGAGKSTLMKILSGVYKKDSGKIFLEGNEVLVNSVKDAEKLGIGIIHQELNLLPYRDIAQNIFLGNEPIKRKILNVQIINQDKMYSECDKLLQTIGINIDSHTMVKNLGIAQKQMIEIAKALSLRNLKILIMDEPTATLTKGEIDKLFSLIRAYKAKGISVIYISHRMEEIQMIGDRVTVLRDGKYIGTVPVKETPTSELIKMMVGREITNLYNKKYNVPGEEALKVENLTLRGKFTDISFKVHQGEIVSFYGLVGAGRTEVAKTIFGEYKCDKGNIYTFGQKLKDSSPTTSVEKGLGLLPEDRREEGLITKMSVKQNIVQASLKKVFPTWIVNDKIETEIAKKTITQLNIVPPNENAIVGSLSGGNQQKVVLGKWLLTESEILIFDEPTRGIDIGAKAEIYELMNNLAAEGRAIMMISSDLPEIIGMSDRIYVMYQGKIVAEFNHENANQEKIVNFAIGRGEVL
ncbi:sugar ABC transporter ATP-binding protein [Tepidanaerobacter sp. EBM-49]|uniref:sugar ABC transporter ATP-binding protein n=1 Tax=Tepidanaerobacter sp. EBM-49 TaxID=1918504 RepID=UPI000A7FA6D7|nr:sugar ABC transporter ATP-binding protein [Tepidanaerobacter sp. EBM-49]